MRTSTSILIVLALLAPAAAADVLEVPGAYASVQAAVDAAAPGDTVLIAPGDYAEIVDVDMMLALVADGGAVRLTRLRVHDVPAGCAVIVRGVGAYSSGATFLDPGVALELTDNAGPVRIEGATFRGNGGWGFVGQPTIHPDGYEGANVSDCASVAFTDCTLIGGPGQTIDDEDFEFRGQGAPGLVIDGANVSVHGGSCSGGDGGSVNDTLSIDGGAGGDGITARSATLVVQGATLAGGDGGDADCDFISCGSGGGGGYGAWLGHFLGFDVDGWFLDVTFEPGVGGRHGDFSGFGPDGQDVGLYPGSTATHSAVPYRPFGTNSPVREGGTATLTFNAAVGDDLFVWLSACTRWVHLPGHDGVFLVDNGGAANALVYLGDFPSGGLVTVPFTVPELGPGIEDFALFWQGIVRQGSDWHLGPVSMQTYLDGGF